MSMQVDWVSLRDKAKGRVASLKAQCDMSRANIAAFEERKYFANAKAARVNLKRHEMALALAEAELSELDKAK